MSQPAPSLLFRLSAVSEIVDAGFTFVGAVAAVALPKEALGDNEAGERGAIFFLRGFADLFAQSLEDWIGDRRRQRDGDRFIGL